MSEVGKDGPAVLAGRRSRSVASELLTWAYRYRVYLLLAMVFAVMSRIAPRFLTEGNFENILKAAGVYLPAAAGFNIVMIAGHIDLSIGSGMTMGGMVAIGLEPQLGWAGSLAVAGLCGLALGIDRKSVV